jgi:hypothetical protein
MDRMGVSFIKIFAIEFLTLGITIFLLTVL